MGQRPTRKTGIAQTRYLDPALQRTLDAIIERVEVLDGLRGDILDQAVTYRDLEISGFTLQAGAGGGTPQILNTPGTGDGPIPGPAVAPTGLTTAETFLALLITWANPPFNLAHIEIWRGTVDNLSLAVLIGTTVSPQFVDYVGANASYFYWVRAVSTDGTFSPFNDTAGTEGTTGLDPSNITIDSSTFIISDDNEFDITPFLVGTVDGDPAIGFSGQLIIDGTIRAESIVANSIGAEQIAAIQLSAISADIGTITAGVIRTAPEPAFRVELEDSASTAFPLWYGSGPKAAAGGRFYIDVFGNVTVKGLLDAGMIKQSFFTPAGVNQSFRIACDFPNNYSGGIYTGIKAHIGPVLTTGFNAAENSPGAIILVNAPIDQHQVGYHTDALRLYSPVNSDTTVEYGRLGSLSENIAIRYSASLANQFSEKRFWIILKYQYDDEVERFAYIYHALAASATRTVVIVAEDIFITRDTPTWDTLDIRLGIGGEFTDAAFRGTVASVNLTLSTPNFGYSDLSNIIDATGSTVGSTTTARDPTQVHRYH